MGKLLRLTILAGLMVVLGAAEDGMVFGIGSAQARIGRPLVSPAEPRAALTGVATITAATTTSKKATSPIGQIPVALTAKEE